MNALSALFRAEMRSRISEVLGKALKGVLAGGPPDATLDVPAGGGAATTPIAVPAVPGMDALVVTRATLDLRGVPTDAPPVTVTKGSSDGVAQIVRPAPDTGEADLREVKVTGLAAIGGPYTLPGATLGAGEEPRAAHLLLMFRTSNAWGPPGAAAPGYDPPGHNSRYPSMLDGTSHAISTGSGGTNVTITLTPPVRCSGVQVLLVAEPGEDVSPVTSTAVTWSATSVAATWQAVPQQVELALVAGSAEQALGALPTLDGRLDLDLSGALGAQLARLHEASRDGSPSVALRVKAGTRAVVEVRRSLVAWYRKDLPTVPDAALRGSPEALRGVAPAGRIPKACSGALHGAWGPARLVAAADRDDPSARAGVSLRDARRLARWVPLSAAEAGRPLLRLSVYARATEAAELLLAAYAGDPQIIGRPLGSPGAVELAPSRAPAWRRADVTVDPAGRPGVWVVAWVSRGAVQVYARAGACMVSPDGGGAWSTAATLPLVQVHGEAAPGEAAPLTLRAGNQLVTADLRAAGPTGDRGMLVELAPILRAAELASAVDASGVLTLTLSCDQDVDVHPVDLALLYDPWHPGGA